MRAVKHLGMVPGQSLFTPHKTSGIALGDAVSCPLSSRSTSQDPLSVLICSYDVCSCLQIAASRLTLCFLGFCIFALGTLRDVIHSPK